MPELPFSYEPITQRVADRVFGDTVLCQVATWHQLSVQVRAGQLRLELGFEVQYHSCVAGEPGEPIPAGKGLSAWSQTLYANNDCAVYLNPKDPADPRNGQVLYYRAPASDGEAWERVEKDGTRTLVDGGLDAVPEPVMRQGNAFALAMNQPLTLAQLIRYHLNAANEPPFSKFA